MAIDDRPHVRITLTKSGMAVCNRVGAMTMFHSEAATREIEDGMIRQVREGVEIRRRPFRFQVVVAADRDHRPAGGQQTFEHGRITEVSGMHDMVAVGRDGQDPRVEPAMGI